MVPKNYRIFLVLFLAVACLSHINSNREKSRGLACVQKNEGQIVDFSTFPVTNELISQIEDKGLKSSAEYFYRYLSKVEFDYYLGYQQTRLGYGLKSPLFDPPNVISINNWSPASFQGYAVNTPVWGGISNSPTINSYFGSAFRAAPALNIVAQNPSLVGPIPMDNRLPASNVSSPSIGMVNNISVLPKAAKPMISI